MFGRWYGLADAFLRQFGDRSPLSLRKSGSWTLWSLGMTFLSITALRITNPGAPSQETAFWETTPVKSRSRQLDVKRPNHRSAIGTLSPVCRRSVQGSKRGGRGDGMPGSRAICPESNFGDMGTSRPTEPPPNRRRDEEDNPPDYADPLCSVSLKCRWYASAHN